MSKNTISEKRKKVRKDIRLKKKAKRDTTMTELIENHMKWFGVSVRQGSRCFV